MDLVESRRGARQFQYDRPGKPVRHIREGHGLFHLVLGRPAKNQIIEAVRVLVLVDGSAAAVAKGLAATETTAGREREKPKDQGLLQ